jgi:hypothetical protein
MRRSAQNSGWFFAIVLGFSVQLSAQVGLNLTTGGAVISSGAFHVKCMTTGGRVTPLSHTSEYKGMANFGVQFYHAKGELPFLLELTYFKNNFSIDFTEAGTSRLLHSAQFNEHIFCGGITVEPLKNSEGLWRYGFGVYCAVYKFKPENSNILAAEAANYFLGAEGGIRLNAYMYLNAFVRVAPVRLNYASSVKTLIPESFNAYDFRIMQRDMIGGIFVSLDFAQWWRGLR